MPSHTACKVEYIVFWRKYITTAPITRIINNFAILFDTELPKSLFLSI